MRTPSSFRKFAALALAASLLGGQLAPVHAGMIGTSEVLAAEQARADRANLAALLEREDLRRQFAAMGVDAEAAKQRVAGLTDAEVARINQRIAELPAGGDVLGVIVLIFVIFVITDAIGATDIFPFVHPVR